MTFAENSQGVVWLLICSALVMLMQAGFCCLETGLIRAKNSINVAIKNLVDFCVAALLFWAFGFALMFGGSQAGLFGTSGWCFSAESNAQLWAFFLFQLVFCATATTIVSGAVAERIRFSGYLVTSMIVAGLIYPVLGHWAWGGAERGAATGWLVRLGFIDFAGSTVVHSTGGWAALAAVLVLGPRIGRFTIGAPAIHGHNMPMAALGVFLLWFGWLGFNGGSSFAVTDRTPLILVNTVLAGASGAVAAMMIAWCVLRRPDVPLIMNGVLAGLVGITAGCHVVTPAAGLLIGAVAGSISVGGVWLLDRWKIDDAVGAVPVHAFAGAWGTLAVAMFGDPAVWGTGLGRGEQLLVQALGVAVCFVWGFGLPLLLLSLINRWIPLRVTAVDERLGLNVAEHGACSETYDLLTEMEIQRQSGDFSHQVQVEPHTEIGQIASQYNRVLERVTEEAANAQSMTQLLQESRFRTRAIVESALDCIISVDEQGRIIEFNPAAEQVFGYARDEMLDEPMAERIIPPALRALHTAGFQRLLATGNSQILDRRFEISAIRRDGREFPIEIAITRSSIQGRQVFTAYLRDITERRQAEQSLTRQALEARLLHEASAMVAEPGPFEEQLQRIVDLVCRVMGWPIGHVWLPLDDGSGLVSSSIWHLENPAAHGPFRVETNEIRLALGVGVPGRVLELGQPAWYSNIQTAPNCPRAGLCAVLNLKGAMGFPIKVEQKVVAVLEFFSECELEPDERLLAVMQNLGEQIGRVFERRDSERAIQQRDEQLRQSQKMQAVGSLAGGIAHEFNNLLQAIRGYTTFALEELSPNEQCYQDLQQVLKAADRATTLTSSLLGFGRRQELQTANLHPNQVLKDLLLMLRPLIGEHIQLETDLNDDVRNVHADPTLLQQMLMNLCVNARDAMPSGGKLHIGTTNVFLSAEYCAVHAGTKPGHYVRWIVSDTGCGMSREVQERIFEPFFTTKDVGKGTGLGLALVYGVVQQHQGMIDVYSELGAGTTFRVFLPAVDAPSSSTVAEEQQPIPGGTETILLAEDDMIVREIAERILTQAGYRVLTAYDGRHALEVFQDHAEEISLVLLDVVMPQMNGREVWQQLQQFRPGLPAVFCSGYDPHIAEAEYFAGDRVPFVQKPYDPEELLCRVRDNLDNQTPCQIAELVL